MKKMSIFAMLLAAVVVTSYSVSGTYAKYTSTFTGADTARVAKWAFTVNCDNMTTANNQFTFDLFATVIDANVKEGTDAEAIIAPGTEGSFTIVLANASEVNAEYTIDYTETNNAGIPVEYSLNGTDWYDNIDALDVTSAEAIEMNANNSEDPIKVYWRWVYEVADDVDTDATNETTERNDSDTDLGKLGTGTVKVEAKITAVQVD